MAIRALPDLCLGIVSGRLETTQVSLGVLLCYATRSPGMPGAFFVSLLIDALPTVASFGSVARRDGSHALIERCRPSRRTTSYCPAGSPQFDVVVARA